MDSPSIVKFFIIAIGAFTMIAGPVWSFFSPNNTKISSNSGKPKVADKQNYNSSRQRASVSRSSSVKQAESLVKKRESHSINSQASMRQLMSQEPTQLNSARLVPRALQQQPPAYPVPPVYASNQQVAGANTEPDILKSRLWHFMANRKIAVLLLLMCYIIRLGLVAFFTYQYLKLGGKLHIAAIIKTVFGGNTAPENAISGAIIATILLLGVLESIGMIVIAHLLYRIYRSRKSGVPGATLLEVKFNAAMLVVSLIAGAPYTSYAIGMVLYELLEA